MAPSLNLPAPWLVAVLLAVSVATLTSGQCDEGRFGPGCGHLCHCGKGSACDVSSGECVEGCQEGYSGPWCQRRNVALGTLIQGYWNDTRHATHTNLADGNEETCETFLIDGRSEVSVTLNSTTDVSNVVISIQRAGTSNRGGFVNVSSGSIICASHPITEGQQLLHTGCDFKNDNFSLDFNDVYYGTLCEVWVFVCEPGFHGDECDHLCGHCRNDDCNQKTGTCAQGCEAGYTGSFCNQTCAQGTYGENCANICGHCRGINSCDPQNGRCAQGCKAGYTGRKCKDIELRIEMWVGVGAGACVVLVGGVVGVWCLCRKRGCRPKKQAIELNDDNSIYLSPIPCQARTIDTRNSQNAYCGLDQSTEDVENPYEAIDWQNEFEKSDCN